MLPWWGWVLLWAGLVLGVRWMGPGRVGPGGARRLGREVARAGALVEALEARVDELADVDPPRTAVTQPPHRLRGGVSRAAARRSLPGA